MVLHTVRRKAQRGPWPLSATLSARWHNTSFANPDRRPCPRNLAREKGSRSPDHRNLHNILLLVLSSDRVRPVQFHLRVAWPTSFSRCWFNSLSGHHGAASRAFPRVARLPGDMRKLPAATGAHASSSGTSGHGTAHSSTAAATAAARRARAISSRHSRLLSRGFLQVFTYLKSYHQRPRPQRRPRRQPANTMPRL